MWPDPFGLFESKVVQEGVTSFYAVSYLKCDLVTNELKKSYFLPSSTVPAGYYWVRLVRFFFVNELNSILLFSSKVKTELTTFISTIFCEC